MWSEKEESGNDTGLQKDLGGWPLTWSLFVFYNLAFHSAFEITHLLTHIKVKALTILLNKDFNK